VSQKIADIPLPIVSWKNVSDRLVGGEAMTEHFLATLILFLCACTIAVIVGLWTAWTLSAAYHWLRRQVRTYRVRRELHHDATGRTQWL
jgi:ABC-type spermidine/putrescine transport system permease subunit II